MVEHASGMWGGLDLTLGTVCLLPLPGVNSLFKKIVSTDYP